MNSERPHTVCVSVCSCASDTVKTKSKEAKIVNVVENEWKSQKREYVQIETNEWAHRERKIKFEKQQRREREKKKAYTAKQYPFNFSEE